VFALLGPNGAGKTTLLHILCTILRPDSGSARIGGIDVVKHPLEGRRHIGVVFQEPSLDDRLTLYENLNFHGLVYGVPAATRRQRITDMLALVELTDWRDRLVRTLSAGMKRRLEIARALFTTRTLFLDELTAGLTATRDRLRQYLRRLRSGANSPIITTHYIEEVEGCDRVCIIDHGKYWRSTPAAPGRARPGAAHHGERRGDRADIAATHGPQ
jgi:ABC-2 type transport system ATP-binding protein